MKKVLRLTILMILSIGLFSCQHNARVNTEKVKSNLSYFKDENTNLCYAATNSYIPKLASEITSITCVPCDSVFRKQK